MLVKALENKKKREKQAFGLGSCQLAGNWPVVPGELKQLRNMGQGLKCMSKYMIVWNKNEEVGKSPRNGGQLWATNTQSC